MNVVFSNGWIADEDGRVRGVFQHPRRHAAGQAKRRERGALFRRRDGQDAVDKARLHPLLQLRRRLAHERLGRGVGLSAQIAHCLSDIHMHSQHLPSGSERKNQ